MGRQTRDGGKGGEKAAEHEHLKEKMADLEQKLEGLLDEKTREQIRKAAELAYEYEDYINIPIPTQSSRRARVHKREQDKGEDLLRNFEDNVFNWDNKATKNPALDAFKNVFTGFDKLRRTFDTEQKEIVDETDFGKNMAAMVALMRQQIETSEREAKSQNRRFYISLAVALASILFAMIAFLI
ncbi:MAG: hypothetical protein JSW53_04170 [Candidatus Bathyarchaeota archaeon]|nr:MAG: hypothetical protein JSW53_04170 [Candidatus Bathyarchaeota archaeon]